VRVAAGSALHPPQNHTQEKKNFRDSHPSHPSLKRKQNYKNCFEVQRTGTCQRENRILKEF
jgi:hypothetical protein